MAHGFFDRARAALPTGRTLPDEVFNKRHRALRTLLWLHALALPLYGISQGLGARHVLLEGGALAMFALLAGHPRVGRRARAALVSVGLLSASAILVHFSNGLIEAHFHFFVMISLLTLYEDWIPFLAAMGYVVVHHGLAGMLDPGSVFNHPAAIANPWKWGAIHGGFVTAAAAANVISWRMNEDERATTERAHREARQSDTRFKHLFEDAPMGIAMIGVSGHDAGRFLLANPALGRMLGHETDALIGRRARDFVHPDDRQVDQRWLDEVMSERDGPSPRVEERLVHAAGHTVHTEISTVVVRDAAGVARYRISQVQDETENRRRAEETHLLEARLAQSERLESLGQLAGGIAHDFNNLLAVIVNYASFLKDDLADGRAAREDVDEIEKAAERAAALTRQLLMFSRREVIQPELLDLTGVITGVRTLLTRALGEHVQLEFALEPEPWPVMADSGQLEQVLVNLAVNARDAMPAGGSLRMATTQFEYDPDDSPMHPPGLEPGPYVQLSVTDAGCGMSEEVLAHVFEPFFTTKPAGSGTGLGLATVYGIVRQMGGQVTVYSEVGRGTTFNLYFPAAADMEAVPARPAAEAPPRGKGEIVLLVEDEDAVRQVACRILREAGYEVRAASSTQEALEICHAEPDLRLLLTDVVMPGMSGPELAERVCRARRGLDVLYMSGYPEDFIGRSHVLPQGVMLLQKPFSATTLLRKVRDVLEPRESVRESGTRHRTLSG